MWRPACRFFVFDCGLVHEGEHQKAGWIGCAAVAQLGRDVRELENATERPCILTDTMTLEPVDLGLGVRVTEENEGLQAIDLSGSLSEVSDRASRYVERRKIAEALKTNDGNKSRTAGDLGVSYKTLLTKIKDYEL